MTVSAGVVEAREGWPELLREADEALYSARHAGGDRVALYEAKQGQALKLARDADASHSAPPVSRLDSSETNDW